MNPGESNVLEDADLAMLADLLRLQPDLHLQSLMYIQEPADKFASTPPLA